MTPLLIVKRGDWVVHIFAAPRDSQLPSFVSVLCDGVQLAYVEKKERIDAG